VAQKQSALTFLTTRTALTSTTATVEHTSGESGSSIFSIEHYNVDEDTMMKMFSADHASLEEEEEVSHTSTSFSLYSLCHESLLLDVSSAHAH